MHRGLSQGTALNVAHGGVGTATRCKSCCRLTRSFCARSHTAPSTSHGAMPALIMLRHAQLPRTPLAPGVQVYSEMLLLQQREQEMRDISGGWGGPCRCHAWAAWGIAVVREVIWAWPSHAP